LRLHFDDKIYPLYREDSLTYREILRQGADGFTYCPKQDVLLNFNALKNPSSLACFSPGNFGPRTNTVTTKPSRATWTPLKRRHDLFLALYFEPSLKNWKYAHKITSLTVPVSHPLITFEPLDRFSWSLVWR
jgi:hypothetical protein